MLNKYKNLKVVAITPLGEKCYQEPDILRVAFTQAYSGGVRADVYINKNRYVLDLDILASRLEEEILEKGYTVSKTTRQKYPRININK